MTDAVNARCLELLARIDPMEVIAGSSIEPWARRAMSDEPARCLGAFDLAGGVAVACAVIRPASIQRPRRTILVWVGLSVAGNPLVWLDRSSEIPMSLYAGDPNGQPSTVNGDTPWIYSGASEEAIESGIRLWRSRVSSRGTISRPVR